MGSVLFEAELNRQHPRYRLPMFAVIQGRTYDVPEWSMAGFDIAGDFPLAPGDVVDASLALPFHGYQFGLSVHAVVVNASPEKQRASLAFTGLDERQASLLRYITDAVLAGEVVAVGDVLDVARRNETVRARDVPPPPTPGPLGRLTNIGRRVVTTGAVAALGIALAAFLWTNVYDRLFVVRAESAAVAAKIINLASPAVGRIDYLNPRRRLQLGEPLMTIAPPEGDPITVQSPCDCIQVEQKLAGGDFVRAGDTVVTLMRADAPIVVTATVPDDRLMSLYGLRSAAVEFADGSRVDNAGILWLPGKGDGQTELPRSPSTVVIDTGRELTADMLGQPVTVRFDLFSDSTIGRVVASFREQSTSVAATLPDRSR
ncbi:alginate biosynthesis protein Alg44 [Pseudochelatococcus lubricantis]|uniref:Alginate biosynthesis protein Alg44 n=1 Tax=Pseudochelatococcus lubricantis TaxID=1538102 RepID=A0ABX0UYQ8_9HYPH|nr:PilZ domain-containing protein [Pseudochelatococcus lubricantis]NIJ57867.1 alginate biosynthesis protein Alg44 [Pseudochelatococcus lubricantis]